MLKLSTIQKEIKEIKENIKSSALDEFQCIFLKIQLLKLKMDRDIYIQKRNVLLHKGVKNG